MRKHNREAEQGDGRRGGVQGIMGKREGTREMRERLNMREEKSGTLCVCVKDIC